MPFFKNCKRALPTWCSAGLLLFFIGLVTRALFFSGFSYTPWIYNDEPGYLLGARALLFGQTVVEPLSLNFPTGYSILLLPAAILTKNPILQYQMGLWITAIFSSLLPVVVYYFLQSRKIKYSFWIALLTGFHPSLFVYSGALMSETLYAFVLVFLFYFYWQKKLNLKNLIFISLLLYLLTIIRSAAITVIVAYYASLMTQVFLRKDKKLFLNVLVSSLALIFLLTIDKYWLKMRLGHYDGGDYLTRIQMMLENPGQATVLLINNSLVFLWMMFGLVFVWPKNAISWIKNNFSIVLFVMLMVMGNIFLTSAHSARQYIKLNNSGYALSFRYLAPYAVLAYNLLLVAFFSNLKKIKLNWIFLLLFSVCLFLFFKNQDWKFANNISVIYLANRSVLKVAAMMLGSTIIFLILVFLKSLKKFRVALVICYFLVLSFLISLPSLNGPRFAKNVYEKEMNLQNFTSENPDRQLFLNRYLEK